MGNISMLNAFGTELEKLIEQDSRVYVFGADLVTSCGTAGIQERHPDRVINVGIAEQNMVAIAAGFAKEGFIPYTFTFAAFHSMRSCEQIRTDVFYNDINVKVIGTHCGMSSAQAGSTHFSLEDIAIIRSMPKSVILAPADPVAAIKCADIAHDYDGGMYIRMDRNPLPNVYNENDSFEVGKSKLLKQGSEIAIFAIGPAVYEALKAAPIIEERTGKSVAVVDVFSIKPLDTELIWNLADKVETIYTVEEHNVCGGLFGAICECISTKKHSSTIFPISIFEEYPHGNPVDYSRARYGLDAEGISRTIINNTL